MTLGRSGAARCTDLVTFRVKEKVGPVWVGLHVLELKELPQAQDQNLLTNLQRQEVKKCGWRRGGGTPGTGRWYLVPQLLRQLGGLVQRETRHQGGGEHVGAAQLVDDLGDEEEGVVQQQLPGTDTQGRGAEFKSLNAADAFLPYPAPALRIHLLESIQFSSVA